MADRETNVANFATTKTTITRSSLSTSFPVEDATTFPPAPFFAVIEPESATNREVVLFDEDSASTTLYTSSSSNRYLEGSAASSGISHPAGSTVLVAPLAQHIEDLNDRADAIAAAVTVAGAADDLVALDGSGGFKAVDSGAYAPSSGQYAVNTVAASGATETLPATHPAHNVTMDESCTFTFTSPTTDGHTFILRLSGAFTPTFPASVVWDGGTAPTYATPSVYAFTTLDGGTSWIGSLVASGLA